MLPESLTILLEHTTIWFYIAWIASFLAVIFAYKYTKNICIDEESSARPEDVEPSYMEPIGEESLENEEKINEILKYKAGGDMKMETEDGDVCQVDEGGDKSEEDCSAFRPELLIPVDNIPDEMKKAKDKIMLHQMETNMSEDQKLLEKKIQHEQLTEIFKLVKEQEDKYGISSIADMEEQMRLYRS